MGARQLSLVPSSLIPGPHQPPCVLPFLGQPPPHGISGRPSSRCRSSSSPVRTVTWHHSNWSLGLTSVPIQSDPHTQPHQKNPPEMDPLPDRSQATHFLWLFTCLTNQINPPWPMASGTCGRTYNAGIGPSACLAHFLLLWSQRQLGAGPVPFCILGVSTPPTVLASAQG